MGMSKRLCQQLLSYGLLNGEEVLFDDIDSDDDKTLFEFLSNVVIIDEAGVSKELETWMAMYHNRSSAYLFIFLGDRSNVRLLCHRFTQSSWLMMIPAHHSRLSFEIQPWSAR